MSSDAPHRIINTRERGTSTDINRITQLSDRNTALAAWYAAQNDESVSGVLTGLRVTVSGDTVTVNPGLGLVSDGVAAYPDSPYRWVEVPDGTSLTIDVGATKVTGEWMVIDIAPGSTTTITTNVDVFDPTTGSFVSTSLPKEVQSGPVLTVRTSGTANQFPGGVASKMPLVYIFNDGGALSTADVVHCRPLLWSKAPMQTSDAFATDPDDHINHQWVQGGGVSVPADGTTVDVHALVGRYFGHRQAFNLDSGLSFDLSDATMWDGGSVAVTETSVYLYALPAPYPTGYGSLAQREFVVGTGVIAQFSTLNTGSVLKAQTGCIVVASAQDPDTSEIGTQGAVVGTIGVFDVPFRDGGGSVSVKGGLAVYMGAVDWGSSEAKKQEFVTGQSRVLPQSRWPYQSIAAATGSPGGTITFDPRLGHSATGDAGVTDGDGIIPPHVQDMQANVRMSGAVDGTFEFNIDDDSTTTAGLLTAGFSHQLQMTVVSSSGQSRVPIPIVSTGTTITAVEDASSTGNFDIIVLSYIDPIIAAR